MNDPLTSTATDDDFRIVEVSDGRFFCGQVFRDKFGDELPEQPRHLVALFRITPLSFVTLGYLHILEAMGQGLIGGAIVDGRAFTDVPGPARDRIRQRGGVLQAMLEYARDRIGDEYEAFFACTGNERAAAANLRAGYVRTRHEHLFALFHRPLSESRKRELIEKIHAFGPF